MKWQRFNEYKEEVMDENKEKQDSNGEKVPADNPGMEKPQNGKSGYDQQANLEVGDANSE